MFRRINVLYLQPSKIKHIVIKQKIMNQNTNTPKTEVITGNILLKSIENTKKQAIKRPQIIGCNVYRVEAITQTMSKITNFLNWRLKPEFDRQGIDFNEDHIADVIINGGQEILNFLSDRLSHDLGKVFTPSAKQQLERLGEDAYFELKNVMSQCPEQGRPYIMEYIELIVVDDGLARMRNNWKTVIEMKNECQLESPDEIRVYELYKKSKRALLAFEEALNMFPEDLPECPEDYLVFSKS